jgi:hypothetical protein
MIGLRKSVIGEVAGESRWQPDARHLAIGFALLPFVVAYAYAVAKCTEFRTAAVRDWAMRVFHETWTIRRKDCGITAGAFLGMCFAG